MILGLIQISRFPYVCYENGGGTFLIPYGICLLLCGLPLYLMEMILGQYSGTSCTKAFYRMAPIMKGLGYAMLSIPTIMAFYYSNIMAWSLYYIFMGFRSELPWKSCNSPEMADYSTDFCYSKYDNDLCVEKFSDEFTFFKKKCMEKTDFCMENFAGDYNSTADACEDAFGNMTDISDVAKRITPSEEFFKRRMFGQTEIGVENTWEHWGNPRGEMIGCLALTWVIIAASLVKGVQSYGKLSYFITLFPYVILTIFLIMMSLQPGFSNGITGFYMKAEWEKLKNFNIWVAACTQIFFSLGLGVGSQLLMCSYNKFNNNCHRDAWLIALGNSLTSIFAGFIVFGTLGVLAENNGVEVEEVITQGVGLTFQSYPEAITLMPIPPLFNFLFFLMMCLLAMSSIVGMWEPTVAGFLDEFPSLRSGWKRSLIYIGSCFIAFLGGISMCFPSGIFMFNIINDHTASTILYVNLLEILLVVFIYGINKFVKNIHEMQIWMPKILEYFWMLCWVLITPGFVVTITVIGFTERKLDQHEGYIYPDSVQALGYLVELFPICIIFIVMFAIVAIRCRNGEAKTLLRSDMWLPRDDFQKSKINGADNKMFES